MIRYLLVVTSVLLIACNDRKLPSCSYQLNELVRDNPNKVTITFQDDSIIQIQDKISTGPPFNTYTFNAKGSLRLYAFLIDSSNYKYVEEYDDLGLNKIKGSPVVEFRVSKKNNDSISFSCYLAALKKQYENIEIICSTGDTIRPTLLYKSDFHTNMKCFSFKLPIVQNLSNLILYTNGSFRDSCRNNIFYFKDSVKFENVKL